MSGVMATLPPLA